MEKTNIDERQQKNRAMAIYRKSLKDVKEGKENNGKYDITCPL